EFQGALAVFHLDDVLNAPLAVRPFADNDGTLVILQTGGDDLTGAGAVLVHEDHQRAAAGIGQETDPRLGIVNIFLAGAAARADNTAVINEEIADLDSRFE